MKEFILENFDVIFYIVCGIFSLITGSSIFSQIRTNMARKKLKEYLEKAKSRETYTVCPHCKSKISFSELVFHLPSGQVDQDLNGIPDDEEK